MKFLYHVALYGFALWGFMDAAARVFGIDWPI